MEKRSNGYPVAFVGAGPGDPDLITVKGWRLVKEADRIVYAGSLVPESLLDHRGPMCEIYNSAGMTLEETHELLRDGYRSHLKVVRLHTGDPSLYGAIHEQMRLLDEDGIPYYVVPGVSAVFAAAASLGCPLTLPEISQTVILTRTGGRTPVPGGESLRALAQHRTTMAIYLSVDKIDDVVADLSLHYDPDTPVVIAYRVGWPDEKWVQGSLCDAGEMVTSAGIRRQAVILVGEVFRRGLRAPRSRLYHGKFQHGFRHG